MAAIAGRRSGRPATARDSWFDGDGDGDLSAALERHLNRPGWRLLSTRVLVVEDDPFNKTLFREILSLLGHAVIEGHSGHDIVELARRHLPHAIVIEADARDPAAAECRRRLGSDPELAAIPVIALVEPAESRARPPAEPADDTYCLAKPVSVRRFLAVLEHVLTHRIDAPAP